jgi:UDP-2,3-diacylglucosamine pyrophosphatase LpxH
MHISNQGLMASTATKVKYRAPGQAPLSARNENFSPDGLAAMLAATGSPEPENDKPVRKYRAIWISDIHLGTRGCKAEQLLKFLRETESDYLYLVGDIIDGWRLKRSWYWPQSHNDVVQKILRRARKGTKVIYVPGNHDEMARDYVGLQFGGVAVEREAIHQMQDGRRFLVIHGDEFDVVVQFARPLAILGDHAYRLALLLNTWVNAVRRRLGYPYFSLSAKLKHKVKNAVEFISRFEQAIALEAAKRQVDGVICGHIHHAEMRPMHGVEYCNDGDWVESCTALVEHLDGRLEILHETQYEEQLVAIS